jgi:hypothetical protein
VRPEAAPVSELDRERERGQRRDAEETAEPTNHRGERRLLGKLSDRPVERVATHFRLHHGRVRLVECECERPRVEPLPAQPGIVGAGPRARVIDEPVPKQQHRQPMSRPHQLAARVFAGTHQIAGCFLVRLGDVHRDQFAEPQQPREPLSVTAIGLDLVAGRPLYLRRRRHRARDPGRRTGTRQPVTGRACLIGDPDRRRKLAQPLDHLPRQRRRPQTAHLAASRIQHTRNDLARVHVQTHPRTLSHNRRLP